MSTTMTTEIVDAERFEFIIRFTTSADGRLDELAKRTRVKVLKSYPTKSTSKEVRAAVGWAARDAAYSVYAEAFELFIAEVCADTAVRAAHTFVRDMEGDDETLRIGGGMSVRRGDYRAMQYENELQELFPQWLKAHPEVGADAQRQGEVAAAREIADA